MHLMVYSVAGRQIFDILSDMAQQRLLAYIDPGTGSFIIQIIIAAFVGCSLAIKIFWHRIKTFIGNFFHAKGKTPEK